MCFLLGTTQKVSLYSDFHKRIQHQLMRSLINHLSLPSRQNRELFMPHRGNFARKCNPQEARATSRINACSQTENTAAPREVLMSCDVILINSCWFYELSRKKRRRQSSFIFSPFCCEVLDSISRVVYAAIGTGDETRCKVTFWDYIFLSERDFKLLSDEIDQRSTHANLSNKLPWSSLGSGLKGKYFQSRLEINDLFPPAARITDEA